MLKNLVDDITARFQRDQESNRKAVTIADIPNSYQAITPAWLTAILCRGKPGAAVLGYALDTRDDGTTNRRRLFIDYNDVGKQAGLPPTVFCKAAQDLSSRVIMGISGGALAEIAFYNEVRPHLDIHASEAYFAAYDPQSFAMIVVLRDMAGEVEFCDENTPMNRARAESQMALLARLHGRFYQKKELTDGTFTLETWPKFWKNLAGIGLQTASDNGFLAAEHVVPVRLFRRHREIWAAAEKSVETHARRPFMISHSDVHLKNWYVSKNEEMGLGDWQCVIGNGIRDVAYAISTALEIDDRRTWERDLLRIYLEELRECCGAIVSFDDAWRAYRQEFFTSLTFWTGTLTPTPGLPAMQPEATSLKFIKRMTHAIDDLESLDSFG